MPGLNVCITKAGAKSFYVTRWSDGRAHRVFIGRAGELTVAQARQRAQEINGQFATGKNPVAAKRAVRSETTFGELFGRYLETHAKVHKRTWAEDERQFNKYVKTWHHKRLGEIKRADVTALHARIGTKHGKYQANRTLALLTTVFTHAIRNGWDHTNPCTGVQRFQEQDRARFLDGAELRAFFTALADEPNRTIRDCILILLLTGARKGNVQAMRWDDLDLPRGLWIIPAAESKNAKPMEVVLAPPAVELLQSRQSLTTNGFVFESHGKKSGHLVDTRTAWLNLCDRAGLKDLRIHDLRRTLGSWQAGLGASLPIIGRSLGHRDQATTAIYARLDLDPVRKSVGAATQAMLEAGGVDVIDGRRDHDA